MFLVSLGNPLCSLLRFGGNRCSQLCLWRPFLSSLLKAALLRPLAKVVPHRHSTASTRNCVFQRDFAPHQTIEHAAKCSSYYCRSIGSLFLWCHSAARTSAMRS